MDNVHPILPPASTLLLCLYIGADYYLGMVLSANFSLLMIGANFSLIVIKGFRHLGMSITSVFVKGSLMVTLGKISISCDTIMDICYILLFVS